MKFANQLAIITTIMILAGYGRADQTNTPPTVTAQEVKDKVKDAAPATRDYVASNKDEFVASMEKKLKELDAKISDLDKKAEPLKHRAKEKADKALTSLRE